jgi:hypothetical protein
MQRHLDCAEISNGRTMKLDLDTKLRLGPDHVATSIGDETAVMSIKRGRYYAVEMVAERIWEMLETPATPREIIDRLMNEYDTAPEQCGRDVDAFLNELIAEGLVVEHTEDRGP